jgi:hypothetical protein
MRIEKFDDIDLLDFKLINEVQWNGREVKEKGIDPRIELIRNLVFAYLYYYLVTPWKVHAFEQQLLQSFWGDEPQSLTTEPFTLHWAAHPVAERKIDPRIQFIRHIVFTYYYNMIVNPENLPEFEAKLIKTLFED